MLYKHKVPAEVIFQIFNDRYALALTNPNSFNHNTGAQSSKLPVGSDINSLVAKLKEDLGFPEGETKVMGV